MAKDRLQPRDSSNRCAVPGLIDTSDQVGSALGQCEGNIQHTEDGWDICEAHLPFWHKWILIQKQLQSLDQEALDEQHPSRPDLPSKIIKLFQGK